MTKPIEPHPYARIFLGGTATRDYDLKFNYALESVRHQIEVNFISAWASGLLFDCSIGSGRFIGKLPLVTRYRGMDYSQSFVDLVLSRHPELDVKQGNLIEGIDQPDNSFDTVICIRTLSALGHVDKVLTEGVRILKPGGRLIFDYGLTPSTTEVSGVVVATDAEPLDEIVAALPLDRLAQLPLDGLLAGIKQRRLVNRLADAASRFAAVRAVLRQADQMVSGYHPVRILHVLARR